MKILTFTLTVEESKRLIAKGLNKNKLINKAKENYTIIIANGTTNAYVAEELSSTIVQNKATNTAGIIAKGVACVTNADTRKKSVVMKMGKIVNENYSETIKDFTANDVFIKGANCFDTDGNVGILLGGDNAGTIGKSYGYIKTAGSMLVVAVGYEKLIPSVIKASYYMGRDKVDYSFGMKCGLFVISDAVIYTEISALNDLFNVTGEVVASGGVGTCRGSVTIAVQGHENDIKKCLKFIKNIKGEIAIDEDKRSCQQCASKCQRFGNIE